MLTNLQKYNIYCLFLLQKSNRKFHSRNQMVAEKSLHWQAWSVSIISILIFAWPLVSNQCQRLRYKYGYSICKATYCISILFALWSSTSAWSRWFSANMNRINWVWVTWCIISVLPYYSYRPTVHTSMCNCALCARELLIRIEVSVTWLSSHSC